MLIHRDALAVSDVIAKESEAGRYALDCALFDKEGRVVVTDGHMLVRFEGEQCEADDYPKIDGLDVGKSDNVMVPFGELRAVARTLPKPSSVRPYNFMAVVPNGETLTLATSDGRRLVKVSAPKTNANFPDYEKILDRDAPVVAEVCLNADLLYRLAVIAQKCQMRGIRFVLRSKDGKTVDNEPVTFTAQGVTGKIDGAIMPMKY